MVKYKIFNNKEYRSPHLYAFELVNGVLHCAPKSLHWISQLLQHRGQEETSLELRHLIFFMDMEKEKALLSKEVALQRDIIYLDEDLTPTHVAH